MGRRSPVVVESSQGAGPNTGICGRCVGVRLFGEVVHVSKYIVVVMAYGCSRVRAWPISSLRVVVVGGRAWSKIAVVLWLLEVVRGPK